MILFDIICRGKIKYGGIIIMSSLQRLMTDLTQILQLTSQQYKDEESAKLGAIDVYYLEAIYQLKQPTIGKISRMLGQSTPNTNYHIKKLINLGLIEKRIDPSDHRVTHLTTTEKYANSIKTNEEFWETLQQRLEDEIEPRDYAIFKRVLGQTVEIVHEEL